MNGVRACAAPARGAADWPFLLPLLLVAVLGVAPTLRLLWEAGVGLRWSADAPALRVLRDVATWQAIGHSVYTGVAGTLIAVALGGLFGFVLTLTDVRGKGLWAFGFMLPMMIPPQVTALAWLQLSGPSSPLLKTLGLAPPLGSPQPLYSAGGIALLLGIQHAPLVFLSLRASLLTLPVDLIEAARLAGADRARIWRDMVFPLARPGLVAGSALAFVSSLGNFGIPALLGIPAGYYVLPTLIYQKMAGFGTQTLPQVAVLSLLIGAIALAGLGLQSRIQARRALRLAGAAGRPARLPLGRARGTVELLLALALVAMLLAPLAALLVSSLVPAIGIGLSAHTLTLQAYAEMLAKQGAALRALRNSVMLAGAAALALALLALPVAWWQVRRPGRLLACLGAAIEIPYAVPGVVLAIACILLFARPVPVIGVPLYGSLAIILVAYLARFMVVAFKPVHASLNQLDPSLEEAAQLAGAPLGRRLREILLPLVAPSAFAGALLVFLSAVNELTVSALLWSAGNETLGILIFNLNESGDNVLAAAVSVLIVAMVAALMAVLSMLARRLPQGVVPWRN
ncbi:ABC transporter permease [Burkholderia ubonensis]|uniref:ABC transporter permease n=1 Tax=Burkholderia ubonensis TaxID=101571 RepID=UPI0009B3519A|nr:iron ABC transporter permease [Burkholderia ubonensis]